MGSRSVGDWIAVAGGGMAGLCAALTVAEEGKSVLLLEKGSRPGGSLRLSNGFITTYASPERLRAAVPGGDPVVQTSLCLALPEAVSWLKSAGVVLETRPARRDAKGGWRLVPGQCIEVLLRRAEALGIRVECGRALERIRVDGGEVAGIEISSRGGGNASFLPVQEVILATGGFQGNPELMTRYCVRSTDHVYHRANRWSTGDGFLAGLEAGGLPSRGLHAFYGHAMPAPPARVESEKFGLLAQYYGSYAVALNVKGERFADEAEGTGEEVLNQGLALQPQGLGFYIVDDEIMKMESPPGSGQSVATLIERARNSGACTVSSLTLEELCEGLSTLGANGKMALATLREFNRAVSSGSVDRLSVGRSGNRRAICSPRFYAVKVKASVTFTCGGLAINESMEVLKRSLSASPLVEQGMAHSEATQDVPIRGLYAAGADAGGFSHVEYGGGLAAALAGGRRAGLSAAKGRS